jgi:serine/threonine protein kinase
MGDLVIQSELQRLCASRHPRILSLLGVCYDLHILLQQSKSQFNTGNSASFTGLVLEFMDKGNLRSVINTEHAIMSWSSKLTIAVDVCEGMRFLHQSKLAHGSLSSENVLVDGYGRAKLTGFGVDSVIDKLKTDEGFGLLQSNEIVTSDLSRAQKEDVFCYGTILWELVTGKKLPWLDRKQATKKHHATLTLTKEEAQQCLPVIASMLKHCMETKPQDRPAFSDLFDTLQKLHIQEMARQNDQLKAIPDGFICPITQDVMKDPVMLMDGHTYERKAIEDWLKRSVRSPLTNEVLSDRTTLLDNYALKSAIDSFMQQQPSLVKEDK